MGMQDLGMDPYTVDKVVAGFGMPLGPFRCVPRPLPPSSTLRSRSRHGRRRRRCCRAYATALLAPVCARLPSICPGAAELSGPALCVGGEATMRVVAAKQAPPPDAPLESSVCCAPRAAWGPSTGGAAPASLLLPDFVQ